MKTNTKITLAAAALTGLLAGASSRASASPVVPTQTSRTTISAQNSKPNIAGQRATIKLDDADKDKHDCKGKNDCKGKGGCKTGDNGCKGKNSCKGKGGCKAEGSTTQKSENL